MAEEKRGPRKLVWMRGRVSSEECPKSLVTPSSVEMLEKFLAAKEADAFLILEGEWRAEAEG
ncbi:MAG: hypothetical protein ABSF12_27140 [Bryobacteraceae bacterium]